MNVVTADWLADRLEAVCVVDVRDGWEFDGIGHVPGAVNVPFDAYRADAHAAESSDDRDIGDSGAADTGPTGDRRGMLPGADVFAGLMSEAGVSHEDDVVAYDDHHGVFAARLLVTAELYGHPRERLHLLTGDFSAWRLSHETTSEPTAVEPATYEAGEPANSPLVGIEGVAAAVSSEAVLVDTREEWEYEEGHIPGAVQLDWREFVDDQTRKIKPRTELESVLDGHGVVPEKRVLLYCNTARRISHTYVVLRHLGYEDLGFYEGSLTEWEAAGRSLETDK